MARYNDLDPKYWKEYTDINTDSLWIIDKRDNSGVHSPDYHATLFHRSPTSCLQDIPKMGTGYLIHLWVEALHL